MVPDLIDRIKSKKDGDKPTDEEVINTAFPDENV
jgi:hypothetical protein